MASPGYGVHAQVVECRRAKDEAPDPDHVGVHEAVADAVPIKAPPDKHISVRGIATPAVRIRSNA